MNNSPLKHDLAAIIEEFGANPMHFFWVLHDSENEFLDFEKQNERYAFIKAESWHSLNLSNHVLWAISDNGHLLWSNSEQVIAMHPRDMAFISAATGPLLFMRGLVAGRSPAFFPESLFSSHGHT